MSKPSAAEASALYVLVNAARRHMATVGFEGSRARLEQEDRIATEDALRAAVQAALLSPPPLTADFTRSMPGGRLDDSTYEAIEEALDRADAPCRDGARWLTLAERVARLADAGREADVTATGSGDAPGNISNQDLRS
jgi:hypothetical protein